MEADAAKVALPVTLQITREVQQTLEARAAASGMKLADYISALVEQTTRGKLSLEMLRDTSFQRFLESGVTDEQLSDELEKAKHQQRAERQGR